MADHPTPRANRALLTLEPNATTAECNIGLQPLVADDDVASSSLAATISLKNLDVSTHSMNGVCHASAGDNNA
jgi:hypothetical protein